MKMKRIRLAILKCVLLVSLVCSKPKGRVKEVTCVIKSVVDQTQKKLDIEK